MPLPGLELSKEDQPYTLESTPVAISWAHRTIHRASSYCALMALAISSTLTYVRHLGINPFTKRSHQNTNVVQFCAALKKDDGNRQMVYYQVCSCDLDLRQVVSGVRAPQPGVGTFSIPQFVSPFKARAQKYVNMAIANHLNAHVMSTQPFLARMYTRA